MPRAALDTSWSIRPIQQPHPGSCRVGEAASRRIRAVMACWDSDRLDLPRIFGVRVRPEWLGTPTARDPATVTWATQRAKERAFPWREQFTDPDLALFGE